jgi:hypothetical protein
MISAMASKALKKGETQPDDEFGTFTRLVDHVLSVSKSEINRREQKYREQAALRPKRGPKPKATK